MEFATLLEAFRPFAKLLLILAALVFAGIVLDYLTGTLAAKHDHTWSSKIAREGLGHKIGIIIAILLAVLLDAAVIVATKSILKLGITYYGLFAPLVALCYALTEFGSILENLRKLGVYVPKFLTRGFASIKNTVDAHAAAVIPGEHAEPCEDDEDENDVRPVQDDEPPDEEDA